MMYPFLTLDDKTEIAFAGRSNVGKSSLINALFGQRKLAKTSSTPGRTQQLNYFNLNDKIYVVDLPGYGYSKMSKEEKVVSGKFIEEYLFNRQEIALIIFLIIHLKVFFHIIFCEFY